MDISTAYISHQWVKLGVRLLLNTNRKSYIAFKMATFNLTFNVTLKVKVKVTDFNSLYLTI